MSFEHLHVSATKSQWGLRITRGRTSAMWEEGCVVSYHYSPHYYFYFNAKLAKMSLLPCIISNIKNHSNSSRLRKATQLRSAVLEKDSFLSSLPIPWCSMDNYPRASSDYIGVTKHALLFHNRGSRSESHCAFNQFKRTLNIPPWVPVAYEVALIGAKSLIEKHLPEEITKPTANCDEALLQICCSAPFDPTVTS